MPKDTVGRAFTALVHPLAAGVLAPLAAALDPDLPKAAFVSNAG